MKTLKRRDFLKTGLLTGGAVMLSRQFGTANVLNDKPAAYLSPMAGEMPDIVTISGSDPETAIPRLIEALGGMNSLVKSGQTVGLLVNSPWKMAGFYTQPDPVIVVADLCIKAGARSVVCFHPAPVSYWERGKLYPKYKSLVEKITYGSSKIEIAIQAGISLKKAEVFRELKEVDVFISMPVAKHHAGVLYSGNLKGLMGAASSDTNRGMHSPDGEYTYDEEEYLAQCIADLNLVRKPDLCIIDATECGLNNGPAGPGNTVKPNKIIAGRDPLATDVYAATLMGFSADDVLTFQKASKHGIGEIEPGKVKLLEL